jgi:D-lactate dehydrogenase (cytochrome)
MRDLCLGLEVVLPDGRIWNGLRGLRKDNTGYDLTQLFVGSEGTLGVITGLTVRVHPIPERIVVARAAFPTVEAACSAAAALIAAGVQVTRCELLDATTIAALNAYAGADFPVSPFLFLELGGTDAAVAGDLEAVRELVGETLESAADPTERARMWGMRHNALMASLALAPGSRAMTTDVAVPVSELPAAIAAARRALEETDLRGGIVGHVGDGNFHVAFLLDPTDTPSIARAKELNRRVVEDALARGGTCTGEHGVGLGKLDALAVEHGDQLELYAGIKRLFDPNGIMNPGKVVAVHE